MEKKMESGRKEVSVEQLILRHGRSFERGKLVEKKSPYVILSLS